MSAYEISGARFELTLMSREEVAEVVGYYRQLGMPWKRIARLFHSTSATMQNAAAIAQGDRDRQADRDRRDFEKDVMQIILMPHHLVCLEAVASL